MEDIYSAIIGEPTSDKEKLLMIAQKLRKQQQLGQLGQLTGDRVLSPMGAGMVEQSAAQAENLGRRGETARYRRYQEGASAESSALRKAELAWRAANADKDRAAAMELERLRQEGDLKIANIKADSKPTVKFKPMTVKQVDDLTSEYENARQFTKMSEEFKDDYAGMMVPGARTLTNAMAAYTPMLTNKAAESAQSWWAKYNNLYTLPERNRLFGATLTDNEQREWKKNAIGENMTSEQIREKLAWYENKVREKLASKKRNLKAANYDPELIDTIFSDPSGNDDMEEVTLEE